MCVASRSVDSNLRDVCIPVSPSEGTALANSPHSTRSTAVDTSCATCNNVSPVSVRCRMFRRLEQRSLASLTRDSSSDGVQWRSTAASIATKSPAVGSPHTALLREGFAELASTTEMQHVFCEVQTEWDKAAAPSNSLPLVPRRFV